MKRVLALIICLSPLLIKAQGEMNVQEELKELRDYNRNLTHRIDELQKSIDDILWFNRLADVAVVKNPTAMGANNPVKFWSYVFVPKGIDTSKKYPLIVFPHSGVHADFSTYYIHIVKELLAQGYIVVAPEFRGSTGYGKEFWEKIDYGGLEVQDTHASRNYMLENYEFVDKNRIGIIGWSHGGLITLMNIFDYPDDYKCAYAGVPVSDLIARMGYLTDDYRNLFSADYHIGKTANENVAEYRRRSPAWNTHKLKTPLLVHTNTNDDDVYSLEVEHLIKSLKADGKKFEYEIYQEAPGGHSFNRLDTKSAKEIRLKIYAFLAKYLNPPKELKSIADIDRAAYR
ncbi:MAG TPA: prolyl oligopeptidase family serine peptidase [Tenuifilaceae bacterium]|nr:prolyl oligopeptidase family serine peptidase [Tenuifilaceae bacterium]